MKINDIKASVADEKDNMIMCSIFLSKDDR